MNAHPLSKLNNLFLQIEVSVCKGRLINLNQALTQVHKVILRQNKKGNKVIIIGNGGSASIASHIAADFIKNLHIPALVFSDSSLVTCVSNDLGYEQVFSKPMGILGRKGDVLFAISSSGKSKNILNAVSTAKKIGCFVVSFSGFSPRNPLRKSGDINFYVPSLSYGDVEVAHLALCHLIVDSMKII